jgi:hypothetical protein
MAWSPEGAEIWFTASDTGSSRWLHAVTLDGHERVIAAVPGEMILYDTAKGGRALLTESSERVELASVSTVEAGERELSWLDWSLFADLSPDGKTALFSEAGGPQYSVYLRKLDGSPAVRLGDGTAIALSPDGEWVAAFDTHRDPPIPTLLLPTGAGQTRKLTADKLDCRNAAWLPDSKGLLITAKEGGKGVRVFLQPIDGGEPHALTPEGYAAPQEHGRARWQDFRSPATCGWEKIPVADQWWREWKRDSGIGAGRCDGALVRGWEIDPYLSGCRQENPVDHSSRRDDGERQVAKEWTPADRAGVTGYDSAEISADGKTIVYSYNRVVGDLYLVNGLK